MLETDLVRSIWLDHGRGKSMPHLIRTARLGLALVCLGGVAFLVDRWASYESDIITEVSDAGDLIVMLSGHMYKVDTANASRASLWSASEDVLVYGSGHVVITNTDDSGATISAEQIN